MLELDSAGLLTSQIADAMGETPEYIRVLRRSAVDVLDKVSERIEGRAETIKNSPPPEVESPGKSAKKTVGGKRIRPTGESIVEPYRKTVIEMWKAGGNHRTIHPKLVEMGFEGSANAIYQYILKLQKESPDEVKREKPTKRPGWADEFELDKAEGLPDISLESVQRDDVYGEVLKQARETRPEQKRGGEANTAEPEAAVNKPHGSRPASAKTSPLPSYILDLMFGPGEAGRNNEPEQKKKQNRRGL
jgi:hypothetical protein